MSSSLIILALALSNVADARSLYEKAMYDEALAALGPSCDASDDPQGCDEVRAFIYVAIGRETDAAAAFERMLARDPTVSLSTQVAPKIQSLFDARRAALAALLQSELGSIQAPGDDVPVPVKLQPAREVELASATLLLRAESEAEVQRVPMQREGGAWVAMVVLEKPEEARYSLELELMAGAVLILGGAEPQTAFDLASRSSTPAETWLESPAPGSEGEGGVPSWVWWTAGGVVLVGSVVAVLLLTSGSGEGDLTVGVTFDGDPP